MEDGSVGSVAQRLEQGTHNPLVPGSNPGGPIFCVGFGFNEYEIFIHRLWTGKFVKEKISGAKRMGGV